jgi:short-chain Z-isoprenyl diphosphate synthase
MLQRILYRLYGWRLEAQVKRGQIPEHVGVILDGNRRFARMSGYASVGRGHRLGADKVDELVAWCDELGIRVLTLWALSTDNLARDPEELAEIFALVEAKMESLSRQDGSLPTTRRVRAVGRRELLPESTRSAIERVEAETADNGPGELIVAVGYGGREEITDAVQRMIAERVQQGASLEGIAAGLQPDEIAKYLYAPDISDPDLIIRTSGELRLSGFLLWQSAYSEFYFCDVYWPEFRKIDLLRAIRSYSRRQRRLGR